MTTAAVRQDGDIGSASATQVVLRAHDLAKAYVTGAGRRRDVVRGVSLDITTGSFTAVMGPSGSGKSTLLHMLGGLVSPTAGAVELDGRRLGALDDGALAEVRRHGVGFVFQAFNLVPVLTAAENVALPGAIAGHPADATRARAAELLHLVGLAAQAGQLPSELSGGEQQRVAIARALYMEPAVLLADEPTGNLDSATGEQVLGVLRRAHDELGQTTVVVTHDAGVAAVADEVVLLVDGMIERTLCLSGTSTAGHRGTAGRERRVLRWLQQARPTGQER